jgi:hypothetical protein
MQTIADGVEFDTVAREWRCKWSADSDKASLVAAQAELTKILADLKAIDGVKSVQRVVCGECLEFKVITAVDAAKFGDWAGTDFSLEAAFLEKLKAVEGITTGTCRCVIVGVFGRCRGACTIDGRAYRTDQHSHTLVVISSFSFQSRRRPLPSCPCKRV